MCTYPVPVPVPAPCCSVKPPQRKRQYTSTSTGFVAAGGERWLLTNAHSVDYHTQVCVNLGGGQHGGARGQVVYRLLISVQQGAKLQVTCTTDTPPVQHIQRIHSVDVEEEGTSEEICGAASDSGRHAGRQQPMTL